jgi:hypothetical protein
VERKEVLYDELLIDKDNATSGWAEGGEEVIFSKMNGELDELLVKLFEG